MSQPYFELAATFGGRFRYMVMIAAFSMALWMMCAPQMGEPAI